MHLTDQTKQTADRHRPTARTEHRTGLLPDGHARMIATLFDGDWTTRAAAFAGLA